jgi:hypothetical protein
MTVGQKGGDYIKYSHGLVKNFQVFFKINEGEVLQDFSKAPFNADTY